MSASTSCDTARLRARSSAAIRASSYSPPASADPDMHTMHAATTKLFVILILIRPTPGLGCQISLVVAEDPLDVQFPKHPRRKSPRREILDLPLELALRADDRIDLAEPRLAQHAIQLDAQIAERLL